MDGVAGNGKGMGMDIRCNLLYLRNVPYVPLKHHIPLAETRHGEGYTETMRPYQYLRHDSMLIHTYMRSGGRRMDRMDGVRITMALRGSRNSV